MKTLISFIGTGPLTEASGSSQREYRKATYSIDGKIIGESSFVASVLLDHLNFDAIYLIGTAKSMWEEAYQYFAHKNNVEFNEEEYWKLVEKIDKANHKTDPDSIDLSAVKTVLGENSNAVCIPYGLNRKEQIQIFSRLGDLFSQINPQDEIVLDVTHSFRSLPLFATSVIQYFKSLSKDIKFEKVYYGMLEAMNEFDKIAPIIDISTAIELQQWTTAAYSFKEYGKGQLLADLLGGEEGKVIQIFSDAVNLNYLSEIQQRLVNFQKIAEEGLENEFAQWVVPQVLDSFVKRLFKAGTTQHLFQYELSVWHREKQNYGSAYIVFVESIITYICEKGKVDWKAKKNRENAKEVILTFDDYHKSYPFKLNLEWKVQSEIREIYTKANHIRNNIAHNLSRRSNKAQTDIADLVKFQKEFKTILQKT